MLDDLYLRKVSKKGAFRENYLSRVPALKGFESLSFSSPVTLFVGENGMGKSTLLEAIAVLAGFNPEGGSRNFNFSTTPTHSSLSRSLKLERGIHRPRDGFFLRAESFYNAASYLDEIDGGSGEVIGSYGGRSLHAQSHGESFLALALNRFGPGSLYLLDEPEAALSPQSQLTLLSRMMALAEENCQIILATHSPILMAFPGAQVLSFTEEGIAGISYRETDHWRLTRAFLEDPERFLRRLNREEDE